MIRVLHVITGLLAGGAEVQLYNILSAIDRTRFESMVVPLLEGGSMWDRVASLGVPTVSPRFSPRSPNLRPFLDFSRIVRDFKPDIVQAWMYHANLAALWAWACLEKKPAVVWNIRHGPFPASWKLSRKLIVALGGRLSGIPRRIVYNSVSGARSHEDAGYDPAKTVIICNGFDCELFRPDPEARLAIRTELGLDGSVPLVGYLARFDADKDHPTFLAAASRLVRHGSGAHFVLAGSEITPENSVLREQVNAHPDLAGRLHLLGERRDAPALYAAFDLSTLASISEGFPNVVGESMACGTPCVVTDVADSARLVGDTGLVVPPGDSEALASAWQTMLDMPQATRQTLGMQARSRILESYSLGSIVRQYQGLYEGL